MFSFLELSRDVSGVDRSPGGDGVAAKPVPLNNSSAKTWVSNSRHRLTNSLSRTASFSQHAGKCVQSHCSDVVTIMAVPFKTN